MTALASLRRRPRLAAALALVLIMLLAAWWWREPDADASAVGEQSVVVEPRPFVATLVFAGRIVPGEARSVTAPFDGAIRSVSFAYGNRVAAGDVLLALDTSEIHAGRNDAEAAYLKARQAAQDVAEWGAGLEVARARRRTRAAALDLQQVEREAEESARLLERGLIPRNEHENVRQQLRARRMAAASAEDELADTIARGGPADRRAAALELANARARLEQAQGDLRQAQVRAPASGVIVRPDIAAVADAPIQPGTRLARGQLIGVIARDGGLAVTFDVDESDVNLLRPGLPVTVAGPGFAPLVLRGKISAIAAEAREASGAGAQTRFTATAELEPPAPEEAEKVRIGMTAAVTVITYQQPAAIVLPPAAIEGSAPAASVMVRGPGGPERRKVRVGHVAPGGVEILAGIRAGETVIWQPPDAAAPQDEK